MRAKFMLANQNPKPETLKLHWQPLQTFTEGWFLLDRFLQPEVMAGLIAAGLDGLQQNMNLPAERQSKEQKVQCTLGTWSDRDVFFDMK